MAEPKTDSIFEFADRMGYKGPFGNWLKQSGNRAQGALDLRVTQLKGPGMICAGAIYEYRITGFNRIDFVLGEMVREVKWGYSIDGGNVITRIFPHASGVIGKHEILMKWHISRSLKGRHLKVHAWFEGQDQPADSSAEILGYPFLFHKYREKGKNASGGIADDMCYGDGETVTDHFRYRRAETEALGGLMQLTLQFEVSTLWAGFKDMVADLFSVGELEQVALAMVARFEKNIGGEFNDPVLTKHIKQHPSTVRFIKEIEEGIREKLKESSGNPVRLFDPKSYDIHNSKEYHRPQFGKTEDIIAGGLTICWNDTWAYEVNIEQFDKINDGYLLKYRIDLFDHFGLDISDLSDHSAYYALAGFRAWFALQHIHNFRPFIATVTIENSITGRL